MGQRCLYSFDLRHRQRAVVSTARAVFTHGSKGLGPRAANFQGRHIKQIEIEVWYMGGKKAVHEREI
jgi:hypothetical protein